MGDLSKHFDKKEFKCSCCGLYIPCTELIDKLEKIRKKVKVPIQVNSGTRCVQHNIDVSGSMNSKHMVGLAADIKCSKMFDLLKECTNVFERVGIYSNFIHVDIGIEKCYWIGG